MSEEKGDQPNSVCTLGAWGNMWKLIQLGWCKGKVEQAAELCLAQSCILASPVAL